MAKRGRSGGLNLKKTKILVLGGARSGKSQYALDLCQKVPGKRVFIATCQPLDPEMEERIQLHRQNRDPFWKTVEEFWNPGEQLSQVSNDCQVVLIDCLTLWISNWLQKEARLDQIVETIGRFKEALIHAPVPVVMVSNEVGMGVIAPFPLGRAFSDLQGKLNQEIAALSDQVFLLTAGIPLRLK